MQLMQISKHRYCNYQLASPGGMRPCNAVIQMCANFPVPDAEPCRCGRKEDHCHLKQLNKVEQEAVERMMIFGIIDACVKCLMAKEKILLPPSGQLQDGRNDQPESEDEFKKVKIQALHQRRKSEASTVRFDLNVTSYPTDGAERHKQRKKEGYVPNKKVIKSEVHNDDCGEDLSGIMNIDLPCEAVHFMGLVGQSEVSKDGNLTFKTEHELSRFLLSDGRWLRGSDACLNPGADCDLPQLEQHLYERDNLKDDNDDLTYHQHNTTPGQSCLKHNHVSTAPLPRPGIDVVEIFGGEGRTTQVLVKRFGAIPGKNFDLVVNWDLLDPEHEAAFWHYLRNNKPKLVIMAPPCGGFGPWSRLNRLINHDTWKKTRGVGERLGKLCAAIALWQVQHGLDFLIEQPWQSELFGMKEWENVFAQIRVFGIVVDQCMLGLKMDKPPYAPVKKPTEFLSSSEVVLRPLLGRQCDGRHEHANIGVWSAAPRLSMPSTKAQIWPWKLCSVLAAGIFDLLCSKGRDLMYVLQHFVSCPGCRGHLRRDDPKHTRSGDCRFPRDDAADWTCKGCVLNKPRADPLHTLEPECRWALARTMPSGLGRTRSGHHPRDPRVAASAEPTSTMRVRAESAPAAKRPQAKPAAGLRIGKDSTLPKPKPTAEDIRKAKSITARIPDDDESEFPHVPRTLEPKGAGELGLEIAQDSASSGPTPVPRPRERGDGHDGPRRHRQDAATQADPELQVAGGGDPGGDPDPDPDGDGDGGDEEGGDEWNRFDLGASLQLLRSPRVGVVRRALRRLHIRWYHPGAARMKALLQAAGVTREVINLVQDVTDTCRICRAWSRPGPRSMTTTTLRTRFNEEVQIDLLFYRQYIILHMLDVCTRWTVASLMRARDSDEITKHMQTKWFGLFGPPTLIVCDQEGGLTTEGVGAWLERRGVALKLRAPGQHAQMVERHHEVLRQQLHKLEAQATDDGLRVGFEEVLSEAVFVKNILTTVGNHTPFEAVLGRTPPLLNVLGDQVEMGDDRDAYRLRHAAIESMIQSTAQDRAARAGRHKTRPAGELLKPEIRLSSGESQARRMLKLGAVRLRFATPLHSKTALLGFDGKDAISYAERRM